jgi:hypothetical protein
MHFVCWVAYVRPCIMPLDRPGTLWETCSHFWEPFRWQCRLCLNLRVTPGERRSVLALVSDILAYHRRKRGTRQSTNHASTGTWPASRPSLTTRTTTNVSRRQVALRTLSSRQSPRSASSTSATLLISNASSRQSWTSTFATSVSSTDKCLRPNRYCTRKLRSKCTISRGIPLDL